MEIRAEFFLGVDVETNAEEIERRTYPLTLFGFNNFLNDVKNGCLLDAFATDGDIIEF